VGIHQDWNYVDEQQARSFNVWISLVPSRPNNGGLFVLPGSQQLRQPVRYTPFDGQLYEKYQKKIKRRSIGLNLKAGQAVIYDSALIHFSNENKSKEVRYACGCVCIPENTNAIHYFKEGDSLLCYKTDSQFYSYIQPGMKHDSEPFDSIPFDPESGLSSYKQFFRRFF